MKSQSKTRSIQFNLQVVLMLVMVVAIALAWWRTHDRLLQSQAQIDAMRRAQRLENREPIAAADGRRMVPSNEIQTPAQFVAALREIEDWYEFADDLADPFANTSVADETIPLLLDLLGDPNAEIRARALATLAKIKRHPSVVVPALIPMLEDEDANVRWHAAFGSGQFGEDARSGIAALARQMNDDESPVATFAAMMIRDIDDTIATEPRLAQLLASPIDQNRERAIGALADLGTPTALEAIVRRYRTEDDPKLRDRMAIEIAHLNETLGTKTAEPTDEREPG